MLQTGHLTVGLQRKEMKLKKEYEPVIVSNIMCKN